MRATIVQIPREALDPARPPASRAPRLKRLMEDPRVLKVFHFARFDVAALAHWLGIEVAPLYCTRTASKLARTYTDRHGLKDNLLELLDVELDKVTRHSDWSSPRLTPGAGALRDLRRHACCCRSWTGSRRCCGGRAAPSSPASASPPIPTMAKLDIAGFELLFEH